MCEFEMEFSADKLWALFKYQIKKLVWLYVLMTIALLACGINFILTNLVALGVVLCALGVLYAPICISVSAILHILHSKSLPMLSVGMLEKFKFSKDYVEISYAYAKQYTSKLKTKYFYFNRVVETPKYYLLFGGNGENYVVEKRFMTAGTVPEMNVLLKKTLGPKFEVAK